MSKKHSKTNRQSDASGQRPAYRMRELIVRHGDDWAEHRIVTDDRPRPDDIVEAEIDGLRTANATLAQALQAVDPKAWDRFMRADGHGVITAEPVNAEAPAPADDMIAVVVELENERDEARRMLERAKQRIRQQDRDLARQTGMLREAHERAKADVTPWRDPEERLEQAQQQIAQHVDTAGLVGRLRKQRDDARVSVERLIEQRDRLNDHARDLQQRLDTSQPDMINANQQLRTELEQVLDELGKAKQSNADLRQERSDLRDRIEALEDTGSVSIQERIQGLEAQLKEANRTITRLSPF